MRFLTWDMLCEVSFREVEALRKTKPWGEPWERWEGGGMGGMRQMRGMRKMRHGRDDGREEAWEG